jgi:predicted 2-oxoglutarate/Fe(II)-dependent dioxygenase YbiX
MAAAADAPDRPPLKPGDLAPPLILPDPAGAAVNLTWGRNLAGRTLVLWLTGEARSQEVATALAAARAAFAAMDSPVFAVTPSGPIPGIETLCDPENRVARAVGLAGAGIIVFDPLRRLSLVVPEPGGIEAALAECRRIHAQSTEMVVQAQPPILLIARVVDSELCERLIDYWQTGDKLKDRVAVAAGARTQISDTIKRRVDVPIRDAVLYGDLTQAISRRVAPAVQKAFQRTVTRFETLRIGRYDSADRGAFGRHRDNTTPFTAHRQFAVSINLNDDYAGGEVRFPEFSRFLYRPEAGGAVVFSCSLLHEALPVTRGVRFGLFTFLYDEEGAAQEEEMIARERAAGRNPILE